MFGVGGMTLSLCASVMWGGIKWRRGIKFRARSTVAAAADTIAAPGAGSVVAVSGEGGAGKEAVEVQPGVASGVSSFLDVEIEPAKWRSSGWSAGVLVAANELFGLSRGPAKSVRHSTAFFHNFLSGPEESGGASVSQTPFLSSSPADSHAPISSFLDLPPQLRSPPSSSKHLTSFKRSASGATDTGKMCCSKKMGRCLNKSKCPNGMFMCPNGCMNLRVITYVGGKTALVNDMLSFDKVRIKGTRSGSPRGLANELIHPCCCPPLHLLLISQS